MSQIVHLELERARAQRIANSLNDEVSKNNLTEYIAELKKEQSNMYSSTIDDIDI